MSSAAGKELSRLGRVSIAGVINSLVGYGVIFSAMALGASPYLSNGLGYGVGVLCSFVLHKRFVFAAGGDGSRQLMRFFLVFILAYGANVAALHGLLQAKLDPLPAQLVASVVYVLCMYATSRLWVFRT